MQENSRPGPESTVTPVEPAKEPTLDEEPVEDDYNEITEEESFILNALNRLDQRHANEMKILQRRMEEFQRHYMKEKENLRVDLVSTLFSARKMVHQQQETAAMAQARVQEQKQMIQQLQVVGGLQGQQLVAVQGGPGQPRQQETRLSESAHSAHEQGRLHPHQPPHITAAPAPQHGQPRKERWSLQPPEDWQRRRPSTRSLTRSRQESKGKGWGRK